MLYFLDYRIGSSVPSWAHKAEQKQRRWESYAGANPIEQHKTYPSEQPSWAKQTQGIGPEMQKWEAQQHSIYNFNQGGESYFSWFINTSRGGT